jgi:hypothetical protein
LSKLAATKEFKSVAVVKVDVVSRFDFELD